MAFAGDRRNVELLRGCACPIDVQIGDRDDSATRIAPVSGQVGAAGPCPGAEHADVDDAVGRHWSLAMSDGRSHAARAGP